MVTTSPLEYLAAFAITFVAGLLFSFGFMHYIAEVKKGARYAA